MDEKKRIKTIQTTFASGNSIAVIIPSKVVEIKGIKAGQYLEIEWGDIVGNKEMKIKKKILPTIE